MKRHIIKIAIGIISVVVGIFYFGDGFISNLLWQGCYEGGFPGYECTKNVQSTYKAYLAILCVSAGIILIIWGIIIRKIVKEVQIKIN